MRILALNDDLLGGGAAQLFRRTNELLQRAGHDVVAVTGDDLEPTASPAASVSSVPPRGLSRLFRDLRRVPAEVRSNVRHLYFPRLIEHVSRRLEDRPVDVAHIHNLHGRLSTHIFSWLKAHRIPAVYQVNDYYFFCNSYFAYNRRLDSPCKRCLSGNALWAARYGCVSYLSPNRLGKALPQALRRMALNAARPWRHVDLFFATSDQAVTLLQEWGVPQEKCWKIFNPMRLEEFDLPSAIGDEVVFYGSCLPNKGTETFIRALEHVQSGARIGVYLMGLTPDYERRLRAAAQRRGLHLRVDGSVRWQNGLRSLVASARAVVVPSQWWVTSENVVYEAKLLGKPVIVSRIGGNTELVKADQTGFFFEPGDAKELARYVNLLVQDRDLAEQMGRQSARWAREQFADALFLRRLEAGYQAAIESTAAACNT